jgi:hypothetical protein
VIAQSVHRWATGWTIGVLGFDSRRGLGIFLFTTASRQALGPTQPSTQWIPGALSLGVKRPGREADHLPPSSAEVKECVDLYLHSPIRLHGVMFSKKTGRTLPLPLPLYIHHCSVVWQLFKSHSYNCAAPLQDITEYCHDK